MRIGVGEKQNMKSQKGDEQIKRPKIIPKETVQYTDFGKEREREKAREKERERAGEQKTCE